MQFLPPRLARLPARSQDDVLRFEQKLIYPLLWLLLLHLPLPSQVEWDWNLWHPALASI
jgi:hypothetical protein